MGEKYPRLGFRRLGFEKTGPDRCYRIYGFAFGDLAKPAYVYTAALHAEDEWRTSLAAWSLAEWLGKNLDDPRGQRKLADHSVVIVPMAWPSANLGSLGTPPGPDTIPAASELPERHPPVFYAYQMHLAGGPLSIVLTTMPGINQDWSERIGQSAAVQYRDRYAYWSATEGPQQPLSGRVAPLRRGGPGAPGGHMATRKEGPVTADMMVGDVLRDYPALREKVRELFGEQCLTCKSNQKESITYTGWHKGPDRAKVVRELNGALRK